MNFGAIFENDQKSNYLSSDFGKNSNLRDFNVERLSKHRCNVKIRCSPPPNEKQPPHLAVVVMERGHARLFAAEADISNMMDDLTISCHWLYWGLLS
jgi:hypothetical protein